MKFEIFATLQIFFVVSKVDIERIQKFERLFSN